MTKAFSYLYLWKKQLVVVFDISEAALEPEKQFILWKKIPLSPIFSLVLGIGNE